MTARALYRRPSDAGTTLRDVVLRIHANNATAEVAHCLPDRDDIAAGVNADFIDLASSDSRLYYAFRWWTTRRAHGRTRSWSLPHEALTDLDETTTLED